MTQPTTDSTAPEQSLDFIREIVREDLATGKYDGRVVTRFPPEPNGYLHIGHARSICLNFGIAAEYAGTCHLRFDDTNPTKEDVEYVEAIMRDIRWLGFDWGSHLYYASDYFEQLYAAAAELIHRETAYVCDLSPEEVREHRGTFTEPGRPSPYRDRSVEENLDLFARMRAGEFAEGKRTLRARIDMASPNINLRDPVLYRIQHSHHHRTGDAWCLYPTYDWAHGFSDSLERITHALCSLEFENHRPLYDWLLDQLGVYRPQQIEFSRLELTHVLMSKRHMRTLVEQGAVSGWDDPRMWTLAGLRRRGYTPEAIRALASRSGIGKREGVVDMAFLEHCLREDLNARAERRMAVIDPIRVVIENYPEGQVEHFEAANNPENPAQGTRAVPFSRELWIERDDFREDPPRKFHRLSPGKEVRLRSAYLITCTGVVKDASGAISELRCSYDPATRGGDAPDGRRVKGTLHWVSAGHALDAEVRLYDRLMADEHPSLEGGRNVTDLLNPGSLEVRQAKLEPSLAEARSDTPVQFERLGYFVADSADSRPGHLVFNRAVALRDSWAKIEKRGE